MGVIAGFRLAFERLSVDQAISPALAYASLLSVFGGFASLLVVDLQSQWMFRDSEMTPTAKSFGLE